MRLFADGRDELGDGPRVSPTTCRSRPVWSRRRSSGAQHTVEDRNFEIRKDVLKYDEVMSEQRKVIYLRRQQILDGEELREPTFEAIEAIVEGLLGTFCPGEFPEDWDLDEFDRNLASTLPSDVTRAQLDDCLHIDQLRELVLGEALSKYEAKEQSIGKETLREIERRVMLSVIDQHWREHLYEMDYLREGINLRAMGQKDPLAEWQREGYDMFEAMMASIEEDFVRYVTHLQVIAEDDPAPVATNLRYSAPEDPVQGAAGLASTLAAAPPEDLPAMPDPPAGPAAAQAFDPNDPNATWSRSGSRRPPGATSPATAGAARSTSSATAADGPRPPPASPCATSPTPSPRFAVASRTRAATCGSTRSVSGWPSSSSRRPRPISGTTRTARGSSTTELARLEEDVHLVDGLAQRVADAETLHELGRDEADSSFEGEIATELDEMADELDQLELRALFTGDHDERDAICDVHSGAGGTDAQDWTQMLFRMLTRWAERRGFEVEVDEVQPGTEAGITSATFTVKGRYAYGLLTSERGVHRLIRISPFDANARRQTAFASLDCVPSLAAAEEPEIDPTDLRIDTFRSSGAGGQHVNVTDSAVRITHLPTQIVVSCQNERSQTQNKARAMQILAARLAERQREEREAELARLSADKRDVAFGNQIRTYTLAPYRLVKDERTRHETGNVDAVLDGDLDGFIEAFLQWRRARARQRGRSGQQLVQRGQQLVHRQHRQRRQRERWEQRVRRAARRRVLRRGRRGWLRRRRR